MIRHGNTWPGPHLLQWLEAGDTVVERDSVATRGRLGACRLSWKRERIFQLGWVPSGVLRLGPADDATDNVRERRLGGPRLSTP